MRDRLLAFLVIGVLGLMVFVFFFIRTQPIPLPKPTVSSASPTQTPTITFADPSRGPVTAKVTLVEYADFECTACKEMSSVIDIAMKTFPNDVRLVWKDVPNDSAHTHATAAAIAARCAQQQGKFWEYGSLLFDRQTYLSDAIFTQTAADLNLNADKFAKCVSTKDPMPIVKKDMQEGVDLGLVATPTLFVGSQSIVGVPTIDELNKTIADELARVGKK